MASPTFERPLSELTKDGKSSTPSSRHHSLTQSPYNTPNLPPLTPQLLPSEELQNQRSGTGPRSWSSVASRSKSWTGSKPRQQRRSAEEKPPKELEVEGPFPSPLPVASLVAQQDRIEQYESARALSVSDPSYTSESKQEKKVSRSLSDRVKAALNEMFKKPDADDEGEKIEARHWTDEDY